MSIEGVKFCDMCGGAISLHDVAPVRVADNGRMVQLHLHNRHADDCLAQKLNELAEQYAMEALAAVRDGNLQEPVQNQA